jgi:YVTN family beta-propeller protein
VVIDLATSAVTTIPVGAEPLGIAIDPRGAFVYVTCYGAASVSVIDTRTSAVVATVAVATEPRAIAVSPDGRLAYVTHSSPTCSVIDLQRVTGGPGT